MGMKFACAISALSLVATAAASPASAQLLGPTPYLSTADSPFHPANYAHFYLEDLEDGLVNTPGLTASSLGVICVSNEPGCFEGGEGLIDSVGNGGNPNVGHSLYGSNGSITLTFDASVLGALPTAAGLVWTDGSNPITFQAYDENDQLIGTLNGDSADNSFTGGTAEDRFYGVINAGGVSKLVITDNGGIEIDHIQYGVGADGRTAGGVPEPAAWALMLTGFFGVGGTIRARRRSLHLA